MVVAHNLGFPRIGRKRDLKWALEAYWQGKIDKATLEMYGKQIRSEHWEMQHEAGIDYVPVGDFSFYDHVLDTSLLLGVIPHRFNHQANEVDVDTFFRMARGRAQQGVDVSAIDVPACEMTKWFDTNYHYIVPELSEKQVFSIKSNKLFNEVTEAQAQGYKVKPVLLGPLSYLWLGKSKEPHFDALALLPSLLDTYHEILNRLEAQGVEWVQIDEPILVLDLPKSWQEAFKTAYQKLQPAQLKLLLATYFGGLEDNLQLACKLSVHGLHIDAVRAPHQIQAVLQYLSPDKILSLGVVDGRNVWRTDLQKALDLLQPIHQQLGDRLWIAGSCSLLHSPLDLETETNLDPEIKSWLAFAKQKVKEIALLAKALNKGNQTIADELQKSNEIFTAKKQSVRAYNPKVRERYQAVTQQMSERKNPYEKRHLVQKEILQLPLFPTTTIGSFPQTQEIRALRHDVKSGKINHQQYNEEIKKHIATTIAWQETIGIDVLVHGEFERNDMVEYFGESLAGFTITENGWVQSYGSRCVKPPIIYGDVHRPFPLTVDWISFAQSLSDKPVKGMLTGPTTILCWSFVRDDQPRFETAKQIALALRDEVTDLEKAGIKAIQIDEPAFREGLPLRRAEWENYFTQAVDCFRLASCGVEDQTQIHTHMCYSEFNDIIAAIAKLDADVITIETSRSNMELLQAFEHFNYPNEIGPGVYDIHSPRIPTVAEMVNLMEAAIQFIPTHRLWVNPDCGLKTRTWAEVKEALQNMVDTARALRSRYQTSH